MTEHIPDVWIRTIDVEHSPTGDRFTGLAYDDHLLRRFGWLEVIRLTPGSRLDPVLREEADEVWLLLEGSADCVIRDLRVGSPTARRRFECTLSRVSQLFLPFGVALGASAGDMGAVLLRIGTHQPLPNTPETKLSWEDLLED